MIVTRIHQQLKHSNALCRRQHWAQKCEVFEFPENWQSFSKRIPEV